MFNQKNIGFEPPESDSSNKCDETDIKMRNLDPVANEDEISIFNIEKTVHKARANEGQRLLKSIAAEDKPHVAVICMDLQQTLPTPKLSTGLQYNKRTMWTCNFCIHNVKEKQGTMHVWNETLGKRGSCEVVSCLEK